MYFRGKPYTHLPFKTQWLYRYTRHPLYVGLMIGLWAAPTMNVAILVFALLFTGYILVDARLEEKDLENDFPVYRQYKKEVLIFMPKISTNSKQKITIQSV